MSDVLDNWLVAFRREDVQLHIFSSSSSNLSPVHPEPGILL